ncbi:MAG: hypothetical protein E6X81_08130 [Clostridium butyricum]|nr:hypothetical protein [Clostridium butyricum]
MDEREELKEELKVELQWVKYRIRMLDIIEEKLVKMRKMAEVVKEGDLSADEVEAINTEINNLAEQARALDEESRQFDEKYRI